MTELFALENNETGPLLKNIHEETQTVIVDKKAKQAESLKRSKAKYYQSIKDKPEFLENIKKNSKIYYDRHKDEPEFKEYHRLRAIEHQQQNKEYYQTYRYKKKLNEVIQTLEGLGFEKIAEILIANKKVKMFDVSDNVSE
jgi:hypothetical protein